MILFVLQVPRRQTLDTRLGLSFNCAADNEIIIKVDVFHSHADLLALAQ